MGFGPRQDFELAKAIERAYRSCQLNYGTFGNAVPQVHGHMWDEPKSLAGSPPSPQVT